jgi:hypothetical protein
MSYEVISDWLNGRVIENSPAHFAVIPALSRDLLQLAPQWRGYAGCFF